MEIKRSAAAGTQEKSDIFVSVSPSGAGLEISLTSTVEPKFGEAIRSVIAHTAEKCGVSSARIEAADRGALDFAISARVETALKRASREEGEQ